MSIRYAILGLLAEQPMHGYRLKKIFDRRMSPLWGLTTGQIYQSLGALERVALVESRGDRRGRRPNRRIYSVTPAGQRDLATWLEQSPAKSSRPFREEMLIRLMLLGQSRASSLCQAVGKQVDDATALLERVRRLRDDRASETEPGFDLTGVFLDSMTHHLEADIKNLELFRAEIERCTFRERGDLQGDDLCVNG